MRPRIDVPSSSTPAGEPAPSDSRARPSPRITRGAAAPDPPVLALAAALLAVAVLSAPAAVRGQQVKGQVTGSDAGRPLEGVVVRLLDDEGQEVDGTFTDARGRFTLGVERPGRYRLHAERIGYEAHRSGLFRLRLGEEAERDLRLRTEGVELSGLSVTSERSCSVSPEQAEGTRVLWREARRALEAARWTADRGAVEIRTRNFRRRLGDDLEVEEVLDESRGYGFGTAPYTSLPADELARSGYVDTRGDYLDWYAPDAAVLLSDSFQRTHCFWVTRQDAPEPGWVGLAFTPGEDRDVPEIEGVLWLDQETAALERLEFSYVKVDLATSRHGAGGEVDFFRLPSGPWIVRRWAIQMPLLEKERLRITRGGRTYHREEIEVAGYDQEGGEVVHIRSGDRVLYDFERATVAGVVWDSLNDRPLEGARVELSGTGRVDTTGVQGRFRFTGVPEGSWKVVSRHPYLEELALGPRQATARADPGKLSRVRLSVPGGRALAAELCPDRDRGTGVLLGRVRQGGESGEGPPAAGALVAAAWPSAAGSSEDPESWVHREVRADQQGRYRICGVPDDSEVALRAEAEGTAGSVERVGTTTSAVRTEALELDGTGAADRLASVVRRQGFGPDVAGDGTREGPPGRIVGTVRASGDERPLTAAEVRLGEDRVVATDSSGRFRMDGVGPGTHRVRVRYLGFGSQEALVRVPPGDTVETTFLMETDPVPLPELAVRVEGAPVAAKLVGYQKRKERGLGHFITREDIEETPGNDVADALRGVPGLRVRPCPNSSGDCVTTTRSRQSRLTTVTPSEERQRGIGPADEDEGQQPEGVNLPDADTVPQARRCGVAYWVDGAPVSMVSAEPGNPNSADFVLDQIPKDHVEAIEVYSGPSEIPVQFRMGASGCTKVAIVIWTRVGG